MEEAIVFFSIIGGGILLWLFLSRERPARYRRKPVLTGSEREFFIRLRRALPECLVCPQMAASALIEPVGIGRARQAAVDLIAGKKVGYAIFDEDLRVVAVVELDHRGRLTRQEIARETGFANAGIRTVRFKTKQLPSEAKIRASIYPRAGLNGVSNTIASTDDAIEFQSTPWRNTMNAHL